MLYPGIHYPDEVIQSLEQAHRAVFGHGLVPWKFRDGARSWLLPGLLTAPMWLGDALASGTEAYRYLAQAMLAALSASTAVVVYWWGGRLGRVLPVARRAAEAAGTAAGLVASAAVAWLVTSYALASAPHMRPEWFRGRAGLELMSRARHEADCGVGLLVGWSWTGGYSSLHEDLPIHLLDWDPRTWRVQAFDAWILPRGAVDQRGRMRLLP